MIWKVAQTMLEWKFLFMLLFDSYYKKKFNIKTNTEVDIAWFWLLHIYLVFLMAPSLSLWVDHFMITVCWNKPMTSLSLTIACTGDIGQVILLLPFRETEPEVVEDPFLPRDLIYSFFFFSCCTGSYLWHVGLGTRNLNHWTTREVPDLLYL